MPIEEEVKHLKRMIEEMKNSQDDGALGTGSQLLLSRSKLSTPALQDAFEQLIVNGVDKKYAYDLIKKTAFELGEEQARSPEAVLDLLAAEAMRSTEVSSPLSGIVPQSGNGPIVIALVGPTGVGKTTTVAKIASEAILKRNLKVGLINLDSYKVAAFDQLGTYAKILNVPFRSAGTAQDLQAAISDFRGLDVVLVDTTGRSQKDPQALHEMQTLLSAVPSIRTQIVLSVTTRDTELYDVVNRFSVFRPEGIIMSKLDEGTIYGAIYNISQKAKLPLLYFTTGQRVPEDIEDATPERVASLILDL
jgi:flagellar biosynthesis protein FlhF